MSPSPASPHSVELAGLGPDVRKEFVIRPPEWSLRRVVDGLGALAAHRDLLYTLTLHRIRVRYKQSILGLAWAVVQPLATMAVMAVVFAYIARVPSGSIPYAVLALAGLVPWTCFANALTSGTQSLVGHAALVTRVYFPREILPLTYVLAAVVDCAMAGSVLLVAMGFYGLPPAPTVLVALPILAILIALVTGIALTLAATNVRFRDVSVALPIALQLLLFASPIAYTLESVPPRALPFYILNPLVGVVENFRRSVLGTAPIHAESLLISAVWAAVALPLGYLFFKHVEATAADVL